MRVSTAMNSSISPSDTFSLAETNFRGRGVFAGRSTHSGDVIEVCPIRVLDGAAAEAHLAMIASMTTILPGGA